MRYLILLLLSACVAFEDSGPLFSMVPGEDIDAYMRNAQKNYAIVGRTPPPALQQRSLGDIRQQVHGMSFSDSWKQTGPFTQARDVSRNFVEVVAQLERDNGMYYGNYVFYRVPYEGADYYSLGMATDRQFICVYEPTQSEIKYGGCYLPSAFKKRFNFAP